MSASKPPRRPSDDQAETETVSGIVTRSAEMKRVVELARRTARVDTTVLITGPSGAGKERIARLIHAESARAAGPFVAVNCAALTETLLESELFGHAKGAFTGATGDRVGLFEAASGGTLLLDEVGEVSPAMQAKLLRVLQEHEVRRVGESRNRKVNVRVLAATNRNLADEVAKADLPARPLLSAAGHRDPRASPARAPLRRRAPGPALPGRGRRALRSVPSKA